MYKVTEEMKRNLVFKLAILVIITSLIVITYELVRKSEIEKKEKDNYSYPAENCRY